MYLFEPALTSTEENLAHRAGVQIYASVERPTGRGARDPRVLLFDPPFDLDGQPLSAFIDYRVKTYDSYDGHNQAEGPDWYCITFPASTTVNCVEVTMECPNRDGGWWTSLWVEYWNGESWCAVDQLSITPPYNFNDVPYERRPYETHALTFDAVTVERIRLIGQPGGLAQFTSLAYIAVYHRDLSRWNPTHLPKPPRPYLFRLIPPNTIWDLSESLVKLTGLSINVAYLDHYLDRRRYERWWHLISHNYQGAPELWHLLGATIGWDAWNRIENPERTSSLLREPNVCISFHNTLGRALAPIVVDGKVLGEMGTHLVIIKDSIDWHWHQDYAREHCIAWDEYAAAIKRSPQMTIEQLEGAAELLGMIANTIANLAHTNLKLERELLGVRAGMHSREADRSQLVRKAIDFMQRNLEEGITIAEVAQSVSLSPTYFGILFAEQMGRSPIEFLTDMRIERAKEYLTYTSMSVMDVCVALGYNPSYFTRLYKQKTGFTPGQYIRKFRKL
jgi:AraC-like DNA-binding protein